MKITCPKCSAQYTVDDAQIPPQGVTIKCPKCLNQFVAGAQAIALPGAGAGGAVPLPGAGPAGAIPLPGSGAPGAIPLPGAGAGGAVPLPGMGGGGAIPLPGMGAPGAIPLPGAGAGSIPLPGAGAPGAIPLPGGGVPLPGAGGGVPLPGGGVPLPGGGVPLPGGQAAMNAIFGGGGGGPATAPPATGGARMSDIFGGAPAAKPPPTVPPRAAQMNDIFGSDGDGAPLPANPFHGTNSVLQPQGGGPSMGVGDGLLDFIDGAGTATKAEKQMFRIRKRSGRVMGPYDEDTILAMFRKQELVGSEEASTDGVTWKPLAQIPAFAEVIQQAMAAALSGLDLGGVDLPGIKADLPGLRADPGVDLPGMPRARGGSGVDLPGIRADLPGVRADVPAPIGPDGKPLSTQALLEAERAKDRVATKARQRKESGGAGTFLAVAVLLFFVILGGAGVAAQYYTDYGWFAIKLIGPKLGLKIPGLDEPTDKPTGPPPVDAPPPIELPRDIQDVAALLDADTYKSYRTGMEQQARVVQEMAKIQPPPPEMAVAATNHARFLAYLVVVEDMNVFQAQLATAAGATGGDEVARGIATAGLAFAERRVDDGLNALAPLADPAKGLAPRDLSEVLTWRGIGLKLKGDNENAMKVVDEALQITPRSIRALYQQADLLARVGEPVAATGYAEKILEIAPQHPRANLLIAMQQINDAGKRKDGEKALIALAKGELGDDEGPSQQAAAYMGIARLALGDRRWDEALNNMNKAVELVPSNKDVRLEHGNLALQLREFTVSRESFQKLIEVNPNDEDALIGLARAKMGARDALGAYSDLETASKAKPENARLAFWYGVAAKELLKLDVARAQIARANTLDPKLPGPHVAIIQDLIDKGDLKEALNKTASAQDIVAAGDRNHIRVTKAQIFMRQRSYSLAKKELEQAIKENPRNIEARVQYVDLLIIERELKEADVEVKQALLQDPRNPAVIAASAAVSSAKGQHEKAIELLEEASSLAPNDYTLYLRAGAAAIALGDLARAKGFVDTAGQLQPENPEVLNLRGQVLRATDPKQAARLFVQAIEMSPEDPRLRFELGVTYQGMGANLEAIDRFLEAIKLDPGFADAYYRLGRAYRELGRNKDAEASYRECAKLDKTRADAWVEIAEIQATLGDPETSIDSFKRAMKADPDNPTPVCKMGVTMVERLGEKKAILAEGIRMLQRCIEMSPKSTTAYRKLADAYKDQNKLADAKKFYKKHLDVNPSAQDRLEVCDILRDLKSPCPEG